MIHPRSQESTTDFQYSELTRRQFGIGRLCNAPFTQRLRLLSGLMNLSNALESK
jgi:hypothetical protein